MVPIDRFLMKGKAGDHLLGKSRKDSQRLLHEAGSRKGKDCWGGHNQDTPGELGRGEDRLVNISIREEMERGEMGVLFCLVSHRTARHGLRKLDTERLQ